MKKIIKHKHVWKKTRTEYYDATGKTIHYKCQICNKTKTEWITEYL